MSCENSSPKSIRSKSLPRGKYTFIGIDIDTTGRRLIDEIVQLAAFTQKAQFSQYIMPYMNLNPAARQRHQVRVITIGFFRMLKSMQTYKVVKTKSEIATLLEFLDWIEAQKEADNDSQGVIMIYHEERKFIPYMILEAFKKYNLLQRFLSSVRSFANGFDLAESNCCESIKYFSLRQLSKVLLNTEVKKNKYEFEGNASVRAQLAFEIAHHLAKGEKKDKDKSVESDEVNDVYDEIFKCAHPINIEIAELRNQKKILDRQNSLRPMFLQYFKTTLFHRLKAVTYRRILAENQLDLDVLQDIWNKGKKEKITEIVEKLEDLKSEEKLELLNIIDCHFDPEKKPMKPLIKRLKRRSPKQNQQQQQPNKENVTPRNSGQSDEIEIAAPDSTTKSPIKRQNRRLRYRYFPDKLQSPAVAL